MVAGDKTRHPLKEKKVGMDELMRDILGKENVFRPKASDSEILKGQVSSALERWYNSPVFEEGEYVTPRKNSGIKGRGIPFRVINRVKEQWIDKHGLRVEPVNMIVAVWANELMFYRLHSKDFEYFTQEIVDEIWNDV